MSTALEREAGKAARVRRDQMLALARTWDDRARETWEATADPAMPPASAGFRACTASTYEKCARELRAALKDRSDEAPDCEAAATAAAIEIAEGLRDAVETNAHLLGRTS